MKKSEELMLLLELNGFDITKYKLKKQLEYEKTGNIELYKHKKFADLVQSHYLFTGQKDHFHRNPLTYKENWSEDILSIDQFYFRHPELDTEMTIKEFLQLEAFNEVQKESILYDIFDGWVEEYRESSITQMEHLKDMIKLLPKKSKKYRKPSRTAFVFSVLFLLMLAYLFESHESIEGFPLLGGFLFKGIHQQMIDSALYSFFGAFLVLLTAVYAVMNNFYGRFINDVRSEKNKHADRTFKKWEGDLEKVRLKQSGILEDYVDRVIKKPKKSFLNIKELIGPEILIEKFKRYVQAVQWKYDFMTKYYAVIMKGLGILFTVVFFTNIIFYVVGIGMRGGWF